MRGCSYEQTCVLVSLAHCTGWTAERIGLAMDEIFDLHLAAKDIWNFHARWHVCHDEGPDVELMKYFMDGVGVRLEVIGRPLSETLPPVGTYLRYLLVLDENHLAN